MCRIVEGGGLSWRKIKKECWVFLVVPLVPDITYLSLALLVLLVLGADDEDTAAALDRGAALADLLDRGADLHAAGGAES